MGNGLFNGDKGLLKESNISVQDELNLQYDWFCKTFMASIQNASNDFFNDMFSFKLISLSKNINVLFQGDEYFVTKIRIDKQHDIFFRCSSAAVKIILDGSLGINKKYTISTITDLEAKIISTFNDYLFNHITPFLPEKIDKSVKRKNYDTVNLTFFIRGKLDDSCGKVIVSLPQVLVFPPDKAPAQSYDVSNFNASEIPVNIKVGTTRFHLKDLKNLERDDIVVFENSNINTMRIRYKDYETDFKLTPNPGIVASIGNDDGGDIMEENSLNQNLWDTIQVEMGAEFDAVKITLGELKNIEAGLVVDLASIYDNKISLKVENKIIARGELVIINDRYGVKIEEVYAAGPDRQAVAASTTPQQAGAQRQDSPAEANSAVAPETHQATDGTDSEEFDYSDFDLDDADL